MLTPNRGVGERGSKLHSLVKAVLRTGETSCSLPFRPKDELNSERSSLPRLFALAAAGLLLAALPAAAKPKAAPTQTAVIENTGSTNTYGYTVTVSLTGNTYHVASISRDGSIRNSETGNHENLRLEVKCLFSDLDAAMPLTSLPVRHGMRSASFGTRTTITYKGQQSPDLTFASDPRTTALKADIAAMTSLVHMTNAPKHPIVIHADR